MLKFSATHEWINCIENNEAVIGITEHAQALLGDMVFVELPEVGTTVTAGSEIGVLESVKAAADLYSPASGIVTAINTEAVNNPALVNKDPMHDGWLIKLSISNIEELDSLLTETAYQKLCHK